MYQLPGDINIEEIHTLCTGFRAMNADIGIVKRRGAAEISLLLHIEKRDIQEAYAWFREVEQKGRIQQINAEQRLKEYCGFLSEVLKKECKADSCLMETQNWKMLAKLEGADMEENCIRTEKGIFQVMAVRSLPENMKEWKIAELAEQECVMAVYTDISSVSDKAVAAVVNSEYLGVDGIRARMRRKNPELLAVLNEDLERSVETAVDTGSFILGGVYFLLSAPGFEEMKEEQDAMKRKFAERGISVEALPWKSNRMTREQRECVSMFGMSGKRREEYRCVLLTDAMEKLFPGEAGRRMPTKEESYDIAEMKALFFEEGTGIEENERG